MALEKTRKCAGKEARHLRIQALLAHLDSERCLEPPPPYEELDGIADAILRDAAHTDKKLKLLELSPKGMAASSRLPDGSPKSPLAAASATKKRTKASSRLTAGSPKSPLAAASSTEKAGGSSRTKVDVGATPQALQVRGEGGTCCLL